MGTGLVPRPHALATAHSGAEEASQRRNRVFDSQLRKARRSRNQESASNQDNADQSVAKAISHEPRKQACNTKSSPFFFSFSEREQNQRTD